MKESEFSKKAVKVIKTIDKAFRDIGQDIKVVREAIKEFEELMHRDKPGKDED